MESKQEGHVQIPGVSKDRPFLSNPFPLITGVLAYEACIELTEEQVWMSGLTAS